MSIPAEFVGRWRIAEMETWDQEFVDLVVPGFFAFRKNGTGEFAFGAIEGALDCRAEVQGAARRLAFTFDGVDEGDQVSGRGWVEVNGVEMTGRIYFHQGDDSGFRARKHQARRK